MTVVRRLIGVELYDYLTRRFCLYTVSSIENICKPIELGKHVSRHDLLKELYQISLSLFSYRVDLSGWIIMQISASLNLLLYTTCMPAYILAEKHYKALS